MILQAIINGYHYTIEGEITQKKLNNMIRVFTKTNPINISFIAFCRDVFGEEIKLIDNKN